MGMSAAERQARQRQRRKAEDQDRRDQLMQAREQVATLMVENERLKAEIQSLCDELAQAREQIAVLTAENERPKTAEPTRSRTHPRHEDELLMASLRDRVSRGELVEMRLGVHQTRSFFITQGMMDTAYKIKEQLELGALKEADAFEALQRIAVAD